MSMYSLRIDDIRLPVHLGVTLEEQVQPQMVRVDVNIAFNDMPKGCLSDDINDTICYVSVVNFIYSVVTSKSYHLIEHLNEAIHDELSQRIKTCTVSSISVCKISPPVPSIHGGVIFTSVRTTNAT